MLGVVLASKDESEMISGVLILISVQFSPMVSGVSPDVMGCWFVTKGNVVLVSSSFAISPLQVIGEVFVGKVCLGGDVFADGVIKALQTAFSLPEGSFMVGFGGWMYLEVYYKHVDNYQITNIMIVPGENKLVISVVVEIRR